MSKVCGCAGPLGVVGIVREFGTSRVSLDNVCRMLDSHPLSSSSKPHVVVGLA